MTNPGQRWRPEGTQRRYCYSGPNLQPDELIGFNHAVWRVVRIHLRDPVDQQSNQPKFTVQVRPVGNISIQSNTSEDLHLSGVAFDVYPSDHYPVCVKCLEPLPCREVTREREAAQSIRRMQRYEMPGVCPACEEPVTGRAARQTWPENLIVPNGQPVTFHLRQRCVSAAIEYDKLWRAGGRESLLGFDADTEAVERMLAELDGQPPWGRSASQAMRRYVLRIPPKVNLRPGPCRFRLEGCEGKKTHTGCANGLALLAGCESCVNRWASDCDGFTEAARQRSRGPA